MSAQLIGSAKFIAAYPSPVVGWMGRLMRSTLATVKQDISQLFSFNRYPPNLLADVWLSGVDREGITELAIAADQLSIPFEEIAPCHSVDLAFAKPGPEMASLLPVVTSQV